MFDERQEIHKDFIRAAYQQAIKSYKEGGLPSGAVMVEHGAIIAAGHNQHRLVENIIQPFHSGEPCLLHQRQNFAWAYPVIT